MSHRFFFLIIFIPLFNFNLLVRSDQSPKPKGYLLNCGAINSTDGKVTVGSLEYITDEGFISVGKSQDVDVPNLIPFLSTLRYFPDTSARKYCYSFPVIKGGKYLVRTTYYYGGFDGGKEPPVFDQIVDGTKWSRVNTTEDFSRGLSSYYEIIVAAMGKMMSVCLARNEKTGLNASPFISALELLSLEDSMYNTTDFKKYGLATVVRSDFGSDSIGKAVSFPDDQFNRIWHQFKNENPVTESHANITSSNFWNLPPAKAFSTALTTSRGKTLELQWPTFSLPLTNYFISLYFQDPRSPSPFSWRVFNVSVNGKNFFGNLNVTTDGVMVYSNKWPLSGPTKVLLTPAEKSPVGPLINAGEVLQLVPLGGTTFPADAMAMEDIARSFNNPPPDWKGDPCLPRENSWTGVTCSPGNGSRVVSVNLTSIGLSGSLSPSIANLTSLFHLWLGGNQLSGPIPDMYSLKKLRTLHLESNQFEGKLPESLSQLSKLRELKVQNNKLDTADAKELKDKGVNIQA